MIRRIRIASSARSAVRMALVAIGVAAVAAPAAAVNYPITDAQRATAERVAQAGVPLSELLPDAPDVYTV
jgi:hypothetical protein